MENFIFSINVTLPIFLVMVLGWGLKQTGMLNDNFVSVANKFNFQVTLPYTFCSVPLQVPFVCGLD